MVTVCVCFTTARIKTRNRRGRVFFYDFICVQVSQFTAIVRYTSKPIALCESTAQTSVEEPEPKPVWFCECFSACLDGAGVLFYVKDLCIHGCSSFVREVHTDVERLTFFSNSSRAKRRNDVAYTSGITQVSFIQTVKEIFFFLNKKDFLHSKIYHHKFPLHPPQVDVYSCLHLKGGTLRALDTFPKQ